MEVQVFCFILFLLNPTRKDKVHLFMLYVIFCICRLITNFILWLTSQVHEDPRLFLLEIGTEELPPQDVASASQQVCKIVFHEENISAF